MKKIETKVEIGGKTLKLTTGNLAQQATSAVLAQYGETVVLATVVSAPLKENLDYFPLTVDYQERLYAGGRIKGSRWVKREGRPSDDEILTSRLIDRSIRPMFPKAYMKDVQVVITVLSVDLENSPDIVSALATACALTISPIPWEGPVATLRIGRINGEFVINPTLSEIGKSDIDLVVSLTKDAVLMIEAGMQVVDEKTILDALTYAAKESKPFFDEMDKFTEKVGNKKDSVMKVEPKKELVNYVHKMISKDLEKVVKGMLEVDGGRPVAYDEMVSAVQNSVSDEEKKFVPELIEAEKKAYIRDITLSGKRLDGRKHNEIRDLSAEVGLLPRTHGSAIFQRGQTQVLTVTTLGAPSMEQLIETAEGEETKRYIHHYSMPPYSTGESGRVGYPSRREIGHGALAERALLPVIPDEDTFPYTIRVVSEVLSSNGSTSMASTCGSTLSLMDAGVPLKNPVAGIAMGLIIEDQKKYAILTDIIGLEDGNGDMDFKVAGTKDGITALQLDVKTPNLTLKILEEALSQAKKAREEILNVVVNAISQPRNTVSVHAPKIKVLKVPQEKIGEVIGPGGRMIKSIIAETGAQVDIEDNGTVNITGLTEEEVNKAVQKIEGLTKEVKPGEIYDGVVKRIESFGAFVEIAPGKDGLVHVSDMSTGFVKNPTDIVSMGDKVQVRVKEIDNLGRINLSMLLDAEQEKQKSDKPRRRFDGRRYDNKDRKGRSSGPHFPTSRLMETKDSKYRK